MVLLNKLELLNKLKERGLMDEREVVGCQQIGVKGD